MGYWPMFGSVHTHAKPKERGQYLVILNETNFANKGFIILE